MQIALAGGDMPRGSSVTELIARARHYGYTNVEMAHPKNTQVEGVDRSLQLVSEAGLHVVAINSPTHMFMSSDQVETQQRILSEAIDIAQRTGARVANTYFGWAAERDDEVAIVTYARNLQPCLKRAEASNVTIVLENEFDVNGRDASQSDITRRPESILRLVQYVDSPHFRLNFDACNFYFAGVEPYPYAYNLLHQYIGHAHVKDGARYDPVFYPHLTAPKVMSDHTGKYVFLPAGQGGVNWDGFLVALNAQGYNGALSMEPETEESRWDDTCKQTLHFLRERLAKFAS
jgi:sugar phosphate isomerase/epimerase